MVDVNIFVAADGTIKGKRCPPVDTEATPLRSDEHTVNIPVTVADATKFTNAENDAIWAYLSDKKYDLVNSVLIVRTAADYDQDQVISDYKSSQQNLELHSQTINDEITADMLDQMTVQQLVDYREFQIKTRYKHAMNWILYSYDPTEIDSWPEQKADADTWAAYQIANPGGNDFNQAPMLKELAKGKNNVDDVGLTVAHMDAYKQSIVDKSGFFRPYSGGLVGIKKRFLKTIDDIPRDVNGVIDFSGEADPVQAETDAKTALKNMTTSDILAAGIAYIDANSN